MGVYGEGIKYVKFHNDLTLKNMTTGQRKKLSTFKEFFKKVDGGFECYCDNIETSLYDPRFGDGEIKFKGIEGRWWYSITRIKEYKDDRMENELDEWWYDFYTTY